MESDPQDAKGLPNGMAFYRDKIRSETSLDLDAGAIHALGQAALRDIHAKMDREKEASGFSGSQQAFKARLQADSRQRYPDDAAMLDDFARLRDALKPRLAALFEHVPDTKLDFRIFETFNAPTKAVAEYAPPSEDGARPGIVFLNGETRPLRFMAEVLELHEGLPGHHLQASSALENPALPQFRKEMSNAGFVEGWGLYAESLGDALGFYETPDAKTGALAFAAWRAARLVADTGIHAKGWSYDRTKSFLKENTFLSKTEIDAEIARYVALPGQALSYRLGANVFDTLRREATEALGPAFNIRRFHTALLKEGALPLPVLKSVMARWLTREKARALDCARGGGVSNCAL